MIKLPVQVTASTNADWHATLARAHTELERLNDEAESLQANEGRYIRPIAVVRVERTGRDQRIEDKVHAEDVREYLVQTLGVPSEAVAVKSSELDELRGTNLLSEYSPVRWIITRAALMEGWDCPFAYVLVMLDNTQAQRALTQLVGRVMRQPHAQRTHREALDQCYVYCSNTQVGVAVAQVKNGLEQEGLTGLGDEVRATSGDVETVSFVRRERFREKDIFLPLVLHRDGASWIELDYQRHILQGVDWGSIEAPDPQSSMPEHARWQSATVDVGDTLPVYHADQELEIDKSVSISWYARRLSDVVPNPWQASRICQQLVEKLRQAKQSDDDIHAQRSYLSSALREHVTTEVEKQAEEVFKRKLQTGDIRFDLEAGRPRFSIIHTYEITAIGGLGGLMAGRDHKTMQLSLFEPVFERQFDTELERNFARYLDEQKALEWWHRVAVRQGGEYYLRGWRPQRVWPDFVAMAGEVQGRPSVLVFDTKGEHIAGNDDTEYKRRLFDALEGAFNAGKMTIHDGPAKGAFRLVFDSVGFPDAHEAIKGISAAYKAP